MISEAEMDAHVEKHTGLAPWQQRVIEEKRELDERMAALVAIFDTPPYWALEVDDRLLLRDQHAYMHAYSETLGKRIARFHVKEEG